MRISACDRCNERIEPSANFYNIKTWKIEGLAKVDSPAGYFLSRELCLRCHDDFTRWINEQPARCTERAA